MTHFRRLATRFLLLAVAPALIPGAAAQTVEDRLRALEARVETLQGENQALRRQVDSLKSPAPASVASKPDIVQPGGKETKLVIGGFLQAQAEFGGSADSRWNGVKDRFLFRRARIYLAGNFAEHFEFKSEIDLQGNSLSAGTGLRAQANEVYVGWNKFPEATLRFGQLKPAFGAEQLTSDTRTQTVERYLGSDRLTDSRQMGVSVLGELFGKRMGYLAVVGHGNGSNVSANDNSKFLSSARAFGTLIDEKETGRLVVGGNVLHSEDNGVSRPDLGLDSVAGGAIDNLLVGRRQGWGGDVSWVRDAASLSAEYLRMSYDPTNRVPASSFEAHAWHVTGGYFVVPNHLQAIVRRERFDPRRGPGGDETNNWLLGLNYLIKGDDIKLMANYIFGDAPGLLNDHGRLITRVQVVY